MSLLAVIVNVDADADADANAECSLSVIYLPTSTYTHLFIYRLFLPIPRYPTPLHAASHDTLGSASRMGFFQRPTLRTRDDKRTTAAELTLRASIYPLCLVTILFFLWYV